MTLHEFSQIFALLAVQLRQTDADEATIRGYYAGLKDLDAPLVAMAAQELGRSATWFPKTSEWREAVSRIEAKRIDEQRALIRKLQKTGHPLCTACEDTGWEQHADGVKRCACQAIRRLEVLGVRPWPALPEAHS